MRTSDLTPAERILYDLGVTEPSEIDVVAIAHSMGATVKFRPLDGCAARIVGNDSRAVITVNESCAPTRKRFSVGHELGHWFYHRGHISMCAQDDIERGNKKRAGIDQERVADSFGANLLMPRYLMAPVVGAAPFFTWKLVRQVGNAFDTSPVAAAIRLVELNLMPALIVCHNQQGRAWFARAKDVPDRWFPKSELDADSQAFDLMFGSSSDTRPVKVPARAWFDSYEADRYEIREESVLSASGEVLSLLSITSDRMLEDR